MKPIFKLAFLLLCLTGISSLKAQTNFSISVLDEQQKPIEYATIELRKADAKALVKAAISNAKGIADFTLVDGKYNATIIAVGFATRTTDFSFPTSKSLTINLLAATKNLNQVTVKATRPLVQRTQGKTIVNIDAAVNNAGTTVLEVLEKSPGVMVDRNGGISLQGKTSVLVMIDDKPTYLSGAELNNLLSSMNSSQVNQIELITSPSAKYDANGNAGIINIKTKKNKQEGFNGNFVTNIGQGKYLKNNNNLTLNYRKGSFNTFLNYGFNYNKGFTSIYAFRDYFKNAGDTTASLDQDSYMINRGNNNTIKTGLDFYAS